MEKSGLERGTRKSIHKKKQTTKDAQTSIRIKAIFRSRNYTAPVNIPPTGLILSPNKANKPIVGVWIMPDNNSSGMLEDLGLFKIKRVISTDIKMFSIFPGQTH